MEGGRDFEEGGRNFVEGGRDFVERGRDFEGAAASVYRARGITGTVTTPRCTLKNASSVKYEFFLGPE